MHCSLSRDQTIFSKRDRSHCDFSCLLRLVVRGLIFLLPGRVSGPISLLSGRASHHIIWKDNTKWHFTWKAQIDTSNDDWKTTLANREERTLIFSNMIAACIAVFLGFLQLSSAKGIDLTVISVACVSCLRPHIYHTFRRSIRPHISSHGRPK